MDIPATALKDLTRKYLREHYLHQKEGVLTNLGLIKPTIPTEKEILEKTLGFKQFKGTNDGDPELDSIQSSYDIACMIATIVSSTYLSESQKRRALGQIFPDIFRALAK